MKKFFAIIACALLVTAAGCQKKAEAPAADANSHAAETAPAAPAADSAAPAPAADPNAAAPVAPAADPNAAAAPGVTPGPGDVAPDTLTIPENATKTASGLAILKSKVNDAGKAIQSNDLVQVNYKGWTLDGRRFDASEDHGGPATFSPDQLIAGMKEALLLAKEGESFRAWIPENLAYQGQPGAPAGTLVFDFEILKIVTPVMPPKDIPADAVKLDGGLAYRIVSTKEGAPQVGEKALVTLNFAGWKQDTGKLFHSTLSEGQPLTAPVNTFFDGWKKVLPSVHEGDVFQTWIPQEMGIAPQGGDGMDGMLIFEVTVESVTKLPDAPADVAAAPADAEKTASGLASKQLQAGTGTVHPTAKSIVQVNYTGWTTNGEMFDSSIIHGEPAVFPLGNVIAGWTEGVQLMVEGEKRRFWIPEELAYKGQPGAPAGMLVFDVELLQILGELPENPALPPEIGAAVQAGVEQAQAEAAAAPAEAAPAPAEAAPAPAEAAPAPAAN